MEALHIWNENVSPGLDSYRRGTSMNPFLMYSPPPSCVNVCRSLTPDSDPSRKNRPRLFLQPNSSLSPERCPLTSIENLQTSPFGSPSMAMFSKTPVKAEEDVLVMDGIPVKSPSSGNGSGSGSTRFVRPPLQSGYSTESPAGSGSGSKRSARPQLQSGYPPESENGSVSGRSMRPQLQSGYPPESEPGSVSGRSMRPPLQFGYPPESEPGSVSGRSMRPPLQFGYPPESEPGSVSGRSMRPQLQSGYPPESEPRSGSGRGVRPLLQPAYYPGSTRPHRTEICGSSEETGTSFYGARFSYVNQKEHLQPPQHFNNNTAQGQGHRMLTTRGSYTHPAQMQFGSYGGAALTQVNQQRSSNVDWLPTDAALTRVNQQSSNVDWSPTDAALTQVNQQSSSVDWSPTDDGIVVRLPGGPSDESYPPSRMNTYLHINGILYGTHLKKRLDVFKENFDESK